MAHYDLEEQEQIDSIKTWWKMYGNMVTGLLLAVALAAVAWQTWNWYQNSRSAGAAAVFAVLERAIEAGDSQKVKAAAGELVEKFGGTGHAGLGALMAARHSFDTGDLKTARAQLTWVAEHTGDELRDLARLRLASLLLDEKAFDEALKVLSAPPAAVFAGRFDELRGDVLVAQSQRDAARAAYQAALGKMGDAAGASRELLQQKLDALGESS